MTSRRLRGPGDPPAVSLEWTGVLKTCRGYEAYQQMSVGRIDPTRVIAFLMLDPAFPRSARFCLEGAAALDGIEGPGGRRGGPADNTLGRMLSDLRYADLGSLLAGDFNAFLAGLIARCNQVSRAVQEQYSLATGPPRVPGMIIEIQHETRLSYTAPAAEWLAELRVEPASDDDQSCHKFHLAVSPPAAVHRYLDGFGNRVHHSNLLSPDSEVRMLAASVVETHPRTRNLAASDARAGRPTRPRSPLPPPPSSCSAARSGRPRCSTPSCPRSARHPGSASRTWSTRCRCSSTSGSGTRRRSPRPVPRSTTCWRPGRGCARTSPT